MKRLFSFVVLAFFLSVPSVQAAAKKAPVFKLPGIKSEVNLAKYRGKVVYVDFWASWCGPCRKSFPWMNDLQARHKENLKVIAINLDTERKEAFKFLKKYQPKITIAFDPNAKVASAYNVKGMPHSFLIDQQGNLVASHIGFRASDTEKLEAKITKLISRKSAQR